MTDDPMNDVRPSIAAFASGILAQDAERHGAVGAVERAMSHVYAHLREPVGTASLDVMLEHALVLAEGTSPLLANVVLGPRGSLHGYPAALTEADEVVERRAAFMLVAHFIELLAVQVGDELAIRLLQVDLHDQAG